jgi:tRNA 5-methylaminomethyl-2-thiouridine biosynthesis bifunctional protein
VAALRAAPGETPGWQVLDASGRVLAEAPVVVLATAMGTSVLLDTLDNAPCCLPMGAVRGQTTLLPADLAGLRAPLRPVSGQGYALTLPGGQVLWGATSQPDDPDAAVREADHRLNLVRAANLGVLPVSIAEDLTRAARWHGRTGWRAVTADRLPVVGPPVDPVAEALARVAGRRLDSVHHRPRRHGLLALPGSRDPQRHGLYVLTGLGSRGLTSAGLAADILASWVTGAPCPVANELRDALDIARF